MDGTIINYDRDAKTGVIRAEDKKRYKFAIGDWGSVGEPRQGDLIDFEPADNRATEIFATSRSVNSAVKTALADVAGQVRSQLTETRDPGAGAAALVPAIISQRPTMIAGALILFASFLPFIALPPMPFIGIEAGGVNLYSTVMRVSQGVGLLGGMAPASITVPLRLFYLLLAIPSLAAYLLYREIVGTADNGLRSKAGWLALAGPLGIPLGTILIVIMFSGQGAHIGDFLSGAGQGASVISGFFGFGLVLTMAAGVTLIGVTKGWHPIKTLIGSFIYLIVLGMAADIGLLGFVVALIGGFFLLRAVLNGWNPMNSEFAARIAEGPAPVSKATAPSDATIASTSFCSECGAKNEAGAKFCGECGATI